MNLTFENAQKAWMDYVLPEDVFTESSGEWEYSGHREIQRRVALFKAGHEEDENTIKAVFRVTSRPGLPVIPLLCLVPSGDVIGFPGAAFR